VTTNHPLHPTRGSIGKVVGNQEIRLAPDGEILVRGTNVSFELFGRPTPSEDVWLHTGDLGEIGPDGTLFYRGRKKDVIVGPEGLNVYPADVEAVIARAPAVKEAVVLGRATDRGEVVHAVLLLRDPAADPGAIIEKANRELEHHQRIREWTVWPDEDFPRTASTFKVRRHEVAKAIDRRKAKPGEGAGLPEGGTHQAREGAAGVCAMRAGISLTVSDDAPTPARLGQAAGAVERPDGDPRKGASHR
jgi:long-chain acyl-CoA synthetase